MSPPVRHSNCIHSGCYGAVTTQPQLRCQSSLFNGRTPNPEPGCRRTSTSLASLLHSFSRPWAQLQNTIPELLLDKVAASHVPSLWGPERDMIRGRGRVGEANQTKAELGMSLESSPQHARLVTSFHPVPPPAPVQGPQTGSTTVGAGHQMARIPPTTTTTRQTHTRTQP